MELFAFRKLPERRKKAWAGHGTTGAGAKSSEGERWWCLGLKSCRTNALNDRFLADHVCFTLGGRHWRRVIGTSASDPKRTLERGLESELSDAGLLGVIWLADRGPLAAAGRGQFSDIRRLPVGVGEETRGSSIRCTRP